MASKLEENVVREYLRKLFIKKIKSWEYIIYNEIRYVEIPTKTLKDEFGMSPFKQRNILNSLAKQGIISVKLGQSRRRYFSLDKGETVDILYMKKQIFKKLRHISDKKILCKIEELLKN